MNPCIALATTGANKTYYKYKNPKTISQNQQISHNISISAEACMDHDELDVFNNFLLLQEVILM
jgi:hypothetical protein